MLISQTLTAVALTLVTSLVFAQTPITAAEATPAPGDVPMYMFLRVPAYVPVDDQGVVPPNFDTVYSIAWLDLTREPLVVTAPNTDASVYLLPMLDMWSDVSGSPGWSTAGTEADHFLVTPPGWTGTVPVGLVHLPAPSAVVWIIGHSKTDGASDDTSVQKIQDGYSVTPLSRLESAPEAVPVKVEPTLEIKPLPKI